MASSLGDRLRRLRRERNWTQEAVSAHLSVVRSTYAYYESGKTLPDNNTVVQLARLFDVSTDYLLKGEEEEAASAGGKTKAPPALRDASRPEYKLAVREENLSEWQLKEAEQRLVVAFRYLSQNEQRAQLEALEKLAWQAYSKRRKR